jgi:hypothetical protein
VTTSDIELEHLTAALEGMVPGPDNIFAHLQFHRRKRPDSRLSRTNLVNRLTGKDHDLLQTCFQARLIYWDFHEPPNGANGWVEGTARNTSERRDLVLHLLDLSDETERISHRFPVAAIEPPIVIAEEHQPWWPDPVQPFYWNRYASYLRDKRGYQATDVVLLDDATTQVISRLSSPQRAEAFQAKGLVVGYVQSGKTANFTGVMAKAIDAGYRLLIVLSGTQNMLREQTQRRIDMELVGKEGIRPHNNPDPIHDYSNDPAWEDAFVEYGGRPKDLGGTGIIRLTQAKQDFKLLEAGITHLLDLEEEKDQNHLDKPINHLNNLKRSNARIIVAKKNSTVLRKLVTNLAALPESVRSQLPALLIDDESDQASVNTIKPDYKWFKREKQKRTAINQRLSSILELLPRCQYVGYTATPFANVFIDPDDGADIFPKDFIISLTQPQHYMGAADFHDLDLFSPDPAHTLTNEEAHVRSVTRVPGDDDLDLQAAIDMFVLTGAIKLFRENNGGSGDWRHHTMLVHESVRVADHDILATRLRDLWQHSGYSSGPGLTRLQQLFKSDLKPVSSDRNGGSPMPKQFDDLLLYLGSAIQMIEDGGDDEVVLVVNGNRGDQPDFDKHRVWKIIVGGAKLSRGYTIEGLTISWFRRRSKYQDTIMQMGRWFGYRPGYRDLVRLYIGRHEPYGKNRHMDLYEAFEAICRDEEAFRIELRRYMKFGGIRPGQIPPLVQNTHPELMPVARNKMWNATIKSRNFGWKWIERTLVSYESTDLAHNARLIDDLLTGKTSTTFDARISVDAAGTQSITATAWTVNAEELLQMLTQYRWTKAHRTTLLQLELDFLRNKHGDPEIDDWVVLAPILGTINNGTHPIDGHAIPLIRRSVNQHDRIKVMTTPKDRALAEIVTKKRDDVGTLPVPPELISDRRGAMLLYPIKATNLDTEPDGPVMGLALIPPTNRLPRQTRFGVRMAGVDNVVVDPD